MMRSALLTLALLLLTSPLFAAGGHREGYVPVVTHADGAYDSAWTTDVWIYTQTATVVHLWFNRSGRDNGDGASLALDLDGTVTAIPDVVATLFETEGSGSLHYLADGPLTVVSRTWTTAPGGGTYGQTISGVPATAASSPSHGQGGSLRMLVDLHAGFRANVGLVNVSPVAIEATLELFDSMGEPVPSFEAVVVDLAPFDMKQQGDVLGTLEGIEATGLVLRATVTSGEGAIVGYLSEVDNRTNSGSYQEAFRFAP